MDPEVYSLYLKGRYFESRLSAETVGPALRCFGEAIAKDPGFAPAHAGIAEVWGDLAMFNLAPLHEAWPKAREAGARALALDANLAAAQMVTAGVAFWYDWDWAAAEAAFKRALALNPGDATAHARYGWFLLNRRRFDECGAAIRRALSADPLSPMLYALAVGLHAACQRGDEALALFERAVEIAPTFGLPYFHAAVAFLSQGRPDRAVEVVESGLRQGLSLFWPDCILGMARAKQGRRDEAAAILARMIGDRERGLVPGCTIAWVAACLGDFDSAFAWLERGYADRDNLMPTVHVYTDIFAPALAREPRFHDLLARLRLADVASSS